MTEIKDELNKMDESPKELIDETTKFYMKMFELFNQPKTEAEIETEKILIKFVGICIDERMELSKIQHQIDLKNKTLELKVSNLIEKVVDVVDRNIPTNKDDDKRFINLMEKVVDILHTNKIKQINNKEK